MTPEETIKEAQSFLANTSDHYPVTEAILYSRINARQRQLFAIASTWNREYYGEQVTADLDENGCIDLDDLESDDDNLWPIERVDRVEVLTSQKWDPGTHVTICNAYERKSHVAPRVTIRSHILSSAEPSDFDGPGSHTLCIWYSRRPRAIDRAGIVRGNQRQEELEIGDPWDWLLVWDLVKSLIKRTAHDEEPRGDPLWDYANMCEQQLMEAYEQHVRGYAYRAEVVTD